MSKIKLDDLAKTYRKASNMKRKTIDDLFLCKDEPTWQNIETNKKFDIIDKPTRMGRWCNCYFNEAQELVIPMNPNPRDKDLECRVLGRVLRGEATIEAI